MAHLVRLHDFSMVSLLQLELGVGKDRVSYFSYWGKASPAEGTGAPYHLLAFHSLDVAAVGVAYLERCTALRQSFCALLACSDEDFLSWAAFLLVLHDLGKFSEAFQAQRPDLIVRLKGREHNTAMQYTERHDSLGFWLWREVLVDEVPEALELDSSRDAQASFDCWMRAVTGHHGMPPKSAGVVARFFLPQDMQLATSFAIDAGRLLLTPGATRIGRGMDRKAFRRLSEMLSWWFAGVTVMADWLGSDTSFFPYRAEPVALQQYWQRAQQQASIALAASGALPVQVRSGQCLSDFFPHISVPSPLQQWAARVDMGMAPSIVLLEDITGAGKTEAAMMLAYRLMASGQADGFFIGLPTMATANAMYQRVALVYQCLFGGSASLTLAHGQKSLVEQFMSSVLPRAAVEGDQAQLDDTASAQCSAWLADHSKRALLAPAGVGTIDQALLAILHSKHQSLRLLGLFNKVLIVDEVHACDAYMLGLLERLLEFHARTGGAAILLSATLPMKMKQSLLNAYARGRHHATLPTIASTSYPLATRWNDSLAAPVEEALASRANVSRTVDVHYEADPEQVFQYVRAALAQGQCVGWIRNTVADAMAAYAYFSQFIAKDNIILFHARFALADRLSKEQQVLTHFGTESERTTRAGMLMIATQVAEQSLDIDFDALITDLAPVDRVLQRAGRLHRHVRDSDGRRIRVADAGDSRPAPCLWVFGPAWTEQPGANWYAASFEKGQFVYEDHGQLWLTAQRLQRGHFSMPSDAREMIEAVFADDVTVPSALLARALKAAGQDMADASQAQRNGVAIDRGYVRGDQGDWWSEAKTPSRLGEEVREVVLVKWIGDRLVPWAEGASAYSMVKIAARTMATECEQRDPPRSAAVLRFKHTLPNQGRWSFVLVLEPVEGGVWQGSAWTAARGKGQPALLDWQYDADLGLRSSEFSASFATPD